MENDASAQTGIGGLDQVQKYAPYGKACQNCVRSKTRCASITASEKCERCYRLDKDCQPTSNVRKRRITKRSASSISQGALEEKLEGIVQMLQRSHAITPIMSQFQTDIQGGSNTGYPDSTLSRQYDRVETVKGLTDPLQKGQSPVNYPPTPATSTAGKPIAPAIPGISTDYLIESDTELEDYLHTYRTKMVPYCPIVCISPMVTVEEMRQEKPFLFLVIRALCNKISQRQSALILHIKKILGKEMLEEGTKTLDLLLGLLVLVAWGHVYICFKPVNSTLIHLAMSLASDLSLMKPPQGEPTRVMLNYTAQGCPKPMPAVTERSLEERRAAVGLYLVSSIFANFFQRIEPVHWTRYLDDCLKVLGEQKAFVTDDMLVSLVRVQLVCNKSTELGPNAFFGDGDAGVPSDLYVQTLKSQLDKAESLMSQELQSNVTLKLQLLNTRLTLHEHSLSAPFKTSFSDPTTQLKRLESLWICFTVVKSWFDTFLDSNLFPLSSYNHVSIAALTQLGHFISALFRLSTFESPEIQWDRQAVRRELDLGDVLKRVVGNFEQVAEFMGVEMDTRPSYDSGSGGGTWPTKGPWLESMRTLLVVLGFWENKVAAMNAADLERRGGAGVNGNEPLKEFGAPEPQMDISDFGLMDMDMLDDTWIRDMLGGYEMGL